MQKNETIPSFSAKLVLDTNIIMDMLHFADQATLPLLAALEAGNLRALSDPECLAELERVVAYPEFGLDPQAQAKLLARYATLAGIVPAEGEENYLLPRCRDADDQKFLVLAARAGADLLVTRDKALLRLKSFRRGERHCRIVDSPAALRLGSLAAKDPA